jgi:hypothetical protein
MDRKKVVKVENVLMDEYCGGGIKAILWIAIAIKMHL